MESLIEKIKKLDLHAGDVIVLMSPMRLSSHFKENISEQICRLFGVKEILILDEGMDIKLISTETLKAELKEQ